MDKNYQLLFTENRHLTYSKELNAYLYAEQIYMAKIIFFIWFILK